MKTLKVRVVMEMDVPVDESNVVVDVHGPDIFVKNAAWAATIIYLEQAHLRDASKWLAKSKEGKKSTEWQIYNYHDTWADIIDKATKSVEVIHPS